MRLHAREVEDVADEAREPVRLRADHPEGRLLRLLVLHDPLAQRLDMPRIAVSGVRSSWETTIRKLRSRRCDSASFWVISANRSVRCPISSVERASGRSAS